MIRPICRDTMLLSQKAAPATPADAQVITDLIDTLRAHLDGCVGMAANMIGVPKRVIVIALGTMIVPMVNPVILEKSGPYPAEEGCLSLSGVRKTTRFREITVSWQDPQFAPHRASYSGFAAQIIQHEADHLEGILI